MYTMTADYIQPPDLPALAARPVTAPAAGMLVAGRTRDFFCMQRMSNACEI